MGSIIVIQRFIPGKSLKTLLNQFNNLENSEHYQNVLNDFGLSYLKSLLHVLTFCHNQGFGHGDCHDGNIMIFLEQHDTRNSFRAILIDFENSSIKDTLNAKTEKEKIENDIGLFKYFFRKTFVDWKYYEPVNMIFDSYDTMTEYQYSYSIVSDFIDSCIKENKSQTDIDKVLGKLPNPLMGFHIPPTIKCLRKIAEIENITDNFENALNGYKKAISNPDNWKYEVTFEIIEGGVTKIYKDLFDK